MRRRDFISLLGGAAAAWPFVARAQPGEGVRRIGVLIDLPEADPEAQARVRGFREGLERRGWSQNHNVRIVYRFAAGNTGRIQVFAKELVALRPDVILAHGRTVTAALQQESRTVPIVFASVSDPIGSGFITSLARPGGNLTGLLLYEAGIAGKWISMLKEIAPGLTRCALLANPKTTSYGYFLRSAEAAAPALAVDLAPSPVENAADIERSIADFARVPNGGLVVLPDVTNNIHRDLIVALTARHRVPAVYTAGFFVKAGGLMAYAVNYVNMYRQAASYVNRILRGDKPTDLPVQAPTKYETVINLKTAKALDLIVPPGILVAADEVIE